MRDCRLLPLVTRIERLRVAFVTQVYEYDVICLHNFQTLIIVLFTLNKNGARFNTNSQFTLRDLIQRKIKQCSGQRFTMK